MDSSMLKQLLEQPDEQALLRVLRVCKTVQREVPIADITERILADSSVISSKFSKFCCVRCISIHHIYSYIYIYMHINVVHTIYNVHDAYQYRSHKILFTIFRSIWN